MTPFERRLLALVLALAAISVIAVVTLYLAPFGSKFEGSTDPVKLAFSKEGLPPSKPVPPKSGPEEEQAVSEQPPTPKRPLLVYQVPTNNASTGELERLSAWISNKCQPDQLQDVTGLFQQGRSSNYNFYVFCRQGSGKIGRLRIEGRRWSDFVTPARFQEFLERTGSSVVGYYSGYQDDVVFVLQKE